MYSNLSSEMGGKQGAFTHEDIEAFKYTFNRTSMYRLAVNFS